MKSSKILLLAGLALSALIALACRREPTAEAAATTAAEPPAAARPVEHSSLTAPLVLTLGPVERNAAGDFEATAVIEAPRAIGYPLLLSATVPSGAHLIEGPSREKIDIAGPARVTRKIVFQGPALPSDDNPLKVLIEGQNANGSMGLRAERRFPAPAEAKDQRVGPSAPGGRPPLRP